MGRIFGNQFRLESLLGRGGMGEVYCAEQLEIGRRVVLKLLLNSQLWSTPELEERFRREARVLAQLNHPNIVQLYSFGRSDDGISYLAMEFIEGRTLTRTIAERGALAEALALSILDQICSALVEAHRYGIVHRDLKPDNVMTMERYGQPAFVKVLDFGIAKLTRTHDPRLTRSGAILGTPQYMAPEQLREQPVDERTDVYALGLIGYELLTGEVPFAADNTMDLMLRVLSEEATPPSRKPHGTHISAATEALIVRCLAKEPEQRFQTSTALRDALAAIPRSQRASPEPPRADPAASEPAHGAAAASTSDSTPAEYSQPVAHESGTSFVLREHDSDMASGTSVRPRRVRTLAAAAAVLSLLIAIAGVIGWLASLDVAGTKDSTEAAAAPQPSAAGSGNTPEASFLPVREWIQGMPFPDGTEYEKFEPTFIDAHVAAPTSRVIEFYRHHIASKWGAVQELDGELVVSNPSAAIETVTVTPQGEGSRLFIKRRDQD